MIFIYEFPFKCKSINPEALNEMNTGVFTFNEEISQTLLEFTQTIDFHLKVIYRANWVCLDQLLLGNTSFRGLTPDNVRHEVLWFFIWGIYLTQVQRSMG